MSISKNKFIAAIFGIILSGCSLTNSPITFKDYNLFDYYSIKVPLIMNLEKEGAWLYSNDNNFTSLNIDIVQKENKTLEQHLSSLIEECDKEPNEKKTLISKDTLTINGLKGIISCYEKDNNTGAFPVLTYYIISVLQDNNDIIKMNSISTQKKYSESLISSIKSIKKPISDSITIKTNNEKKDLEKLKQDGYQVFEKENFLIKCPAKLNLDVALKENLKTQGNPYPLSSYKGVINDNSPETREIYMIDVIDINTMFDKLPMSKYNYLTNEYLNYYSSKYGESVGVNVTYAKDLFNGVKYYYSERKVPRNISEQFSPANTFPFMVMFFIKDRKLYTIQVATSKDLTKKFNNLKLSFNFINQQ